MGAIRSPRTTIVASLLAAAMVACTGTSDEPGGKTAVDTPSSRRGAAEDGVVGSRAGADVGTEGGRRGPQKAPLGVPLAPDGTAAIFSPADDRAGITPTTLRMCVHGPLALLPLVKLLDAEELNVYWKEVNARGGVFGRRVEVAVEDDQYSEAGLAAALERCRERGVFAITSGTLDVDMLTSARAWAERTRSLYLFNLASEDPKRLHSYSPFVSIEAAGRFGAQWITSQHRGESIGLIHRSGSVYERGREPFMDTVSARGGGTVTAVTTTRNQTSYSGQIEALEGKADVVYILDDPLTSIAIIKQANQRRYRPQWVLTTGLNVVTDSLGDDAVGSRPLEALSLWPPYLPGAYGGRYDRYGREVKRFEEAFERHLGRRATSDVAWIFWAWWRVVHDALERCGPDCTRNRLLSISKWQTDPFCAVDFGDNGNFGGTRVSITRAYATTPASAAWAEVPGQVCKRGF